MRCDCCAGDFVHPVGIKTYGLYALCNTCLLMQTTCVVCGKKRFNKSEDNVCEECEQMIREDEEGEVPIEEDAVPTINWDELIRIRNTQYTYQKEQEKKKRICEHCGEAHILTTHAGVNKKLCAKCYAKTHMCEVCGKQSLDTQATRRQNHACKDCIKKYGLGVEHRWNYKAHPFKLHGSDKDDLYFGIENEVQLKTLGKKEYIQHISKNYHEDDLYMVYDGTINYGVEHVLHPRTFQSLKNFDFDTMMSDVVPHKNTGMHIHISRSGFRNKLHLYKFMKFVSGNKGFVQVIAERSSKVWRAWRFTDGKHVLNKAKGFPVDMDKYVDINVQHPKTIELRIFKGATTSSQVLKNIEFCHALWKFSMVSVPKHMTKFRFLKWLGENSGKYSNLMDFLSKEGLV